jgi:hypothetical protein
MITYRTTGDWGPGTGYNLTAVEIDFNFYDLVLRLADLIANPPTQSDGIDSVDVTATEVIEYRFTGLAVTYSFNVPPLNWRGDWEPDEEYETNDVFYVDGDGLYVVLHDHTSETDPDPGSEEYVRRVYGELNGDISTRPIVLSDDISRPLTTDDDGCYIRCLYGADFELPTDVDAGWTQGSNFVIRQVGVDQVNVVPATGVAINVRGGTVARTNRTGSVIFLRRVGSNQWDCWGSLEV